MRVRLVDGRTFVLHHAAADADTIRGELPKDRLVARHGRRVAFARGDVRSIDARHFNAVKTVGLIAVTIPLAGLAFVEMFHGD